MLRRLKGTGARRGASQEVAGDGHFERTLHDVLEAEIEALPRTRRRGQAAYHRARWLCRLLLSTGCRIGELAGACHRDFIERKEGWWLHVLGKGRTPRLVPVSKILIRELRAFRYWHGLPPYPRLADESPLPYCNLRIGPLGLGPGSGPGR